ncbi:MAG TPA: sulfatase-like hydrolase/transferase [Thermoanaerobaculia bacterium]|nr:sulfatase-like hydrolase/transferase [Thermoanaerobaculia bacterium]
MSRTPFLLSALLLLACAEAERSSRPDVPVFIVSIDTLRADRLPVYGYGDGSTPHIDAFRRDAILFQRAFSNSPQTLPSHASLMTGTIPPVHGVRDNIGYRLPPTLPTIATRLRETGYATGAAVSTYMLRRSTGVHEGFDFYDDRLGMTLSNPTSAERDGEDTRVALTSWLDSRRERRLFGFLHINEPHAPYAAPRQFRRTADPYDNEIAYADDVFGRFVKTLREKKLYDDALIILLSDHGEGLGDHGEDEHGLFVYRESLQVPLLVKMPGGERAGETITEPVGIHQVAALVLAVITSTGVDETIAVAGGRRQPVYSETYHPRLHFGWSELRSLISGDRHFIDAPARELYDYVRDPAEQKNLAATERTVADEMLEVVRRADSLFTAPVQIDPEQRGRIVGGTYESRISRSKRGADPKRKVQVVRDLRRARDFYRVGRYRDAIPLAERVAFYEPEIVEGWSLLGRSRAAAGQPALAIEAFAEGLGRFPESIELALLAAHAHADARNWPAAVRHAERVMPADPVLAHEALAQFALRRGEDATAKRHAEEAVRHAPGRITTLMLLAELARRGERHAEELMWLDRAENEISSRALAPIENVSYERGTALLALRRLPEAERAFRSEIVHFPGNRRAWAGLASVVAAQGRRDEARSILRDALLINAGPEMRAMARETLVAAGDREGAQQLTVDRKGRPNAP